MAEAVSIEKKDSRFVQDLLGEEDKLLINSIRDFVDEQVIPARREIEDSARGDFKLVREMQAKMLPLGLQGGFLPEEYGGMGMNSALTYSLLAEEMGRGESSFFTLLLAGAMAMRPAVSAGNKAVLDHFAPGFKRDDRLYLGCFAAAEPGGGCDVENLDMSGRGINSSARLDGGNWVLNGAKVWVENSGIADVYCVACNTDPSLGEDGIALIYMEVPTEGFTFGGFEAKAGFLAGREGSFHLKGVRVPADWRAAGPGRDAELLFDNLSFYRIVSGALAVGMAQGAFDEVLSFTSDRIAAGKPIRQHTIAANILADIAISIQVGRDTYVNAAYLYDRPDTYGPGHSRYMLSRSSLAKVFCCDSAVMVTNRAMELMGSYGYVTDYHVEKYWRDAKAVQLWGGGGQLGRLDVVRGYYDYNQFHKNELYERIREMSEA